MIIECTRGFGKVEHPETGEEINTEEPFETDRETYELLTNAYPGFRIVEDNTQTPDETPEEPDATEEICGAEMTDGSICERPANECSYH